MFRLRCVSDINTFNWSLSFICSVLFQYLLSDKDDLHNNPIGDYRWNSCNGFVLQECNKV